MAPELTIRLKRHVDAATSLTCARADGSSTWQRLDGPTAMVFPVHDLTHFAVETTLGFRRGFFGLLADGWAIQDFVAPLPRGEIPDEAKEVELIVGFFDSDRRQGEEWTAVDFEAHAEAFVGAARARGKAVPPRTHILTDDDIRRVREARSDLVSRWMQLAPGDTLELSFNRV